MTSPNRENPLADELFRLVERPAGFAHISDGINILDEEEILSLAENSQAQHELCAELLSKFLHHHWKRIALKRPYSPMVRRR